MYVSEISSRFSRGMSTPAIRAMLNLSLTLALLVPRVVADDAHRTVAANHLALVAHLFDRRPDLHLRSCPFDFLACLGRLHAPLPSGRFAVVSLGIYL